MLETIEDILRERRSETFLDSTIEGINKKADFDKETETIILFYSKVVEDKRDIITKFNDILTEETKERFNHQLIEISLRIMGM